MVKKLKKGLSYAKAIIVILFLGYSLMAIMSNLKLITFIYTVLFYFTILIIVILIIDRQKKTNNTNLRIAAISIIISLVSIEICLKYVLKQNLTYMEQNGSSLYESYYVSSRAIDRISRKSELGKLSNFFVSKPNSTRIESKKEYSYTHTYNNLGLRNKSISINKNINEYRIIALGDSFTEGLGAPQHATWPAYLDTILSRKSPEVEINCINAGKAGSDPIYSYKLLSDTLIFYNPDLVILAINGSEIRDIFLRGGLDRYDKQGNLKLKNGPWWECLYATSYIFRYIIKDILDYNDYLVKKVDFEKSNESSFNELYKSLVQFIDLAKNQNFELKIAFTPFYPELYKHRTSLDPLYYYMANNGLSDYLLYIPACYYDHFNSHGSQPLDYYWRLDSHHNSKGYSMLANCISNHITITY